MTNEEVLGILTRLARQTGFSIGEINYIARIVSQADYDPLPPGKWSDSYEFSERKLSLFDDEWDFNCINPKVPKPNAQVDLRDALRQFKTDVLHLNSIYAENPKLTVKQNRISHVNTRDWFRFWSVRHPIAEERADFKQRLREADAAAGRIADKAQTHLRERSRRLKKKKR